MEYECPKCRNTEHPNGSSFCKICGMKIEAINMENENKKLPQSSERESESQQNDAWLYRRFEVINKETLAEAETLITSKKLNRNDLLLLLKTYRIRNI